MKALDFIVIILVLFAGLSGIIYSLNGSGGDFIRITCPDGEYRYSLSKDRVVRLKGAAGFLTAEIKNGRVRVSESSCPFQVCRGRGWIYLSGDSIVCVPNRITIKITGTRQDFDAITE